MPAVVAVGERRQRRHLRDQPDDLHVADLVVLDRARLRIEGRERADRRQQHPHRVGVVAEALHELLDVLVHERVDRDLVRPVVELLLGRQLAVDQQVGDLEVGRLLGQLLDRVAAVLEDPLVAVDEGDRRPARRRGHVGRVVGHQPEVVVVGLDLAQLGRADRAVLDRNLVLLAGAVVGDRQRVAARGYVRAILVLSLGGHGTPLAIAGRSVRLEADAMDSSTRMAPAGSRRSRGRGEGYFGKALVRDRHRDRDHGQERG